MNREDALKLLQSYNQEAFHLQHALTVEQVMRWFAKEEGFQTEVDFWGLVGLLHDIDFEKYPQAHCQQARIILSLAGYEERFVRAVVSHGHGICPGSPEPEHLMEKVLFAVDELTGLIGAAALMRPSRSVQDMELKSLKKKFKDKSFAAGCSRDIIKEGADLLGWELDTLLTKTLSAMRDSEDAIAEETKRLIS